MARIQTVYQGTYGVPTTDPYWGNGTMRPIMSYQYLDDDGNVIGTADAQGNPINGTWLEGASGINYGDIAGSPTLYGSGGLSLSDGLSQPVIGPNGEPMYSDGTNGYYSGGADSYGSVGNSIYGNVSGTTGSGSSIGMDSYGNPIIGGSTSLGSNLSGGSTSGGSTGSYGGYTLGGGSGGSTSGSYGGGSSSSGGSGGGSGGGLQALPESNTLRSSGYGSTSRTSSGSTSIGTGMATTPTTSLYTVSPLAYTQAMNAELSELDAGMAQIRQLVQSGQIQNNQQLSAALNEMSSKTGLGINELQNAFQQGVGAVNQGYSNAANALTSQYGQAINQYAPITAGAAGDVANLRDATNRGFDEDFAKYQQSQAFQAPLQQATGDINQSAAARRMNMSSGNLKNLGQYISDYTSKGYNDYRSQRMGEAQNLANTSLNALQTQTGLRGQLGSQLASTFGQQGSNVGQLQGQYGNAAANAYSTLGANLSGTRQAFTGLNTDLTKSLSEATGQYYGARADARNRGITGRGTRAIEIRGV